MIIDIEFDEAELNMRIPSVLIFVPPNLPSLYFKRFKSLIVFWAYHDREKYGSRALMMVKNKQKFQSVEQ